MVPQDGTPSVSCMANSHVRPVASVCAMRWLYVVCGMRCLRKWHALPGVLKGPSGEQVAREQEGKKVHLPDTLGPEMDTHGPEMDTCSLTHRWLKSKIAHLPANLSVNEGKEYLKDHIHTYLMEKIVFADRIIAKVHRPFSPCVLPWRLLPALRLRHLSRAPLPSRHPLRP